MNIALCLPPLVCMLHVLNMSLISLLRPHAQSIRSVCAPVFSHQKWSPVQGLCHKLSAYGDHNLYCVQYMYSKNH